MSKNDEVWLNDIVQGREEAIDFHAHKYSGQEKPKLTADSFSAYSSSVQVQDASIQCNKRVLEQTQQDLDSVGNVRKKFKATRNNSMEDFMVLMSSMFDRRNSLAATTETANESFDLTNFDFESPLDLLNTKLSAPHRRLSIADFSDAKKQESPAYMYMSSSFIGKELSTSCSEKTIDAKQTSYANEYFSVQPAFDPSKASSHSMLKLARVSLLQSMERSTKSFAALHTQKVPSQMLQAAIKTLPSRRKITNYVLADTS